MGSCASAFKKPGGHGTKSDDAFSDKELAAIFKEFDMDSDGFITQSELRATLRRLGLNPTTLELNAMFTAADKDTDGKISYNEFKDLMDKTPALASLKAAFRQFDLDGDGYITEDELRKVSRSLGQPMTDAEITAMFYSADVNHDSKISFDEFANMMKRRPLVLNLRDVFRQFDVDGDGFISEAELRVVCRQLSVPATDREVALMFQAADSNGDGKISFEEFSTLLAQKNK